jgi:hypothetical protein
MMVFVLEMLIGQFFVKSMEYGIGSDKKFPCFGEIMCPFIFLVGFVS